MRRIGKAIVAILAIAVATGDFELGGHQLGLWLFGFVTDASARVGRPLTPVSAAGVARRTTRRVIRRGAFIATIPAGCPYGAYYGYHLYYCGGTYYQKSGSGYVIVYF
jgi:hypothetical protein